MYQMVYVSSATKLFSDSELVDLLEKARAKNRALGITGLLLYKAGNFMQLLEGPQEAVCSLAERIARDPRHSGFTTLLQGEAPAREFSEWEMGFKKIDPKTGDDIPGYSDFLKIPFDSEEFRQTPSKGLKLMLNFKDMMR